MQRGGPAPGGKGIQNATRRPGAGGRTQGRMEEKEEKEQTEKTEPSPGGEEKQLKYAPIYYSHFVPHIKAQWFPQTLKS